MSEHLNVMTDFNYQSGKRYGLDNVDLGMLLLKPDATNRPGISRDIIEYTIACLSEGDHPLVMHSMGLQRLRPEQISLIYPEERVAQHLEIITDYLCSGPVVPIMVAYPNAPNALNGIKGSVRTGEGIRGTFLVQEPISRDDLEDWRNGGFSDQDTRYIGTCLLAANLVHIPDDGAQALMIARQICPRSKIFDMLGNCGLLNSLPKTR
jgi:nucleoside diphosphate kinase